MGAGSTDKTSTVTSSRKNETGEVGGGGGVGSLGRASDRFGWGRGLFFLLSESSEGLMSALSVDSIDSLAFLNCARSPLSRRQALTSN